MSLKLQYKRLKSKMETTELYEPVILIVDDNPENLQVLGKLLKEKKYKVEFAVDGETALEWVKDKKFDLVLLDINMPGMNGFEVCRKIRSDPGNSNLPVIFLSADNDRESMLKGFELGGQDYVTKPFDSRELIVRVKTHLDLKYSLEKLKNLNQVLEEKVQERTHQLKEANEKLEATNLRLIDLDKAKTDFLNIISHEIRTPLNGIMGPLELLKAGYTSEISELTELLDLSVNRLEQFAMDAVLITQLNTKSIQLKKEKIILSGILNDVLLNYKDKLQPKNLNTKLINDSGNKYFDGDENLIKKCFQNILDNAVRFSPNKTAIVISVYIKDNNIICEIHDQGKGFSSEKTIDSFKLFSRGQVYSDNSMGNGLPIVKMIMELHGGEVVLANHPEGGAVVKLIFLNSHEQ